MVVRSLVVSYTVLVDIRYGQWPYPKRESSVVTDDASGFICLTVLYQNKIQAELKSIKCKYLVYENSCKLGIWYVVKETSVTAFSRDVVNFD